MNTIVIMGRLTAAPELKITPSGVYVTNFSVAVDRKYQQQGERKTDFIDCIAWRKNAEFIANYFDKGQMIAIDGELQTENYTDKDGNNRKSVRVLVNNVSFCGSKGA